MKILKGYVENQYQSKASIIEQYITEEAIEFCSSYMPTCEPIGVPKSSHEGKCEGKGVQEVKIQSVSRREVNQAHLYTLNNIVEVIPYILEHIDEMKSAHPRIDPRSGDCSGLGKKDYRSYIGMLAKTKIPIMIALWNDVAEVDKNLLW